MGNGTEDMGLLARVLRGPSHGLAINGDARILLSEGGQPPAEQVVDFTGVDSRDKSVEGAAAGDEVASLSLATAQSLAHRLREMLCPVRDGFIAAGPAHGGTEHDGGESASGVPLPLHTAWIGERHHKGQEGVCLCGIQSHLRGVSFLIELSQHRVRQDGSGVRMQAPDQEAFRAAMLHILRIGLAKPAGQPELVPAGGFIAGPVKTGRIDEGFDEKQGVAVALVPIGCDPFRAEREDFRGEVGLRTARQDEKPGVVGQQMEALPVKTGRPADPVVAGVGFEGRCRKYQ